VITALAVSGYRSLRDFRLALGRITVVTGPNGAGKSSFYRALRLLADVAQGRAIQSLAAEGGLESTLWTGPEAIAATVRRGDYPVQGTRRKGPIALKLGFMDEDFGYAIDLGLPPPALDSYFTRDPQIKAESLRRGARLTRAAAIADRRGPAVSIRNQSGAWATVMTNLSPVDSMMTHCADPTLGVELLLLREKMRSWRFYDHFRSDRDAPARQPQIGTFTPILAHDGADLAAAVATILEIGDAPGLADAVEDAFPGARLSIAFSDGQFELAMTQHGLLRPLRCAELSDGTLRYLLWVAALLSPRPPPLMVLNEPETSLHVDLLPALARLIARAAERSQIVLVSHDRALLNALPTGSLLKHVALRKDFGETIHDDDEPVGWTWPER
jgi:predicted ATPase